MAVNVKYLILGLWLISVQFCCCGESAKSSTEIINSFIARRNRLTEIELFYNVRNTQFNKSVKNHGDGHTIGTTETSDTVTTQTVQYVFKDSNSRYISESTDSAQAVVSEEISWCDGKRKEFRIVGGHTYISTKDDLSNGGSNPGIVKYWYYTGFTPKWLVLDEDDEVEYNFAKRDFSRATVVSEDSITTVTFDKRETFVFNRLQLVAFERRLISNGFIYKYECEYEDATSELPKRIIVDVYASNGKDISNRTEIIATKMLKTVADNSAMLPGR